MKQVTLRYPDSLHARLQRLAEIENRSVNAQIITAIKAYVERREQEFGIPASDVKESEEPP